MNIVQMAAHRMAFDSQALKVASQNMAFLNVPKYQAVRLAPLRFDDSLQPQDMRRTDPKHLSFKGETWGGFAVKTAATGEKTLNGNTVSYREELREANEAKLSHLQMTNIIQSQVQMLELVLKK